MANSEGGRLSRKESSSLRNAAVNAIWTKCRLKEAGYELETTLCDMCGQENDTLWHRIWFCRNPQVVPARNRFANTALQTEATREDVDLLCVTRAIIDDPSDHLMLRPGIWALTTSGRTAMAAVHRSSRVK